MYIPGRYTEERYHTFTIIFDGRFFPCRCAWSVWRNNEDDYVLSICSCASKFVIRMYLRVVKVQYHNSERWIYATDISTHREYRHLMIYLRYYCIKLKHRPYHEAKHVIMRLFYVLAYISIRVCFS